MPKDCSESVLQCCDTRRQARQKCAQLKYRIRRKIPILLAATSCTPVHRKMATAILVDVAELAARRVNGRECDAWERRLASVLNSSGEAFRNAQHGLHQAIWSAAIPDRVDFDSVWTSSCEILPIDPDAVSGDLQAMIIGFTHCKPWIARRAMARYLDPQHAIEPISTLALD